MARLFVVLLTHAKETEVSCTRGIWQVDIFADDEVTVLLIP